MQTLIPPTVTESAPAANDDAQCPAAVRGRLAPPAAGRDTRDLLSGFSTDGGQADFEEIVRRYGGMVLKVCWQVTGHREDAEDAAQAVFVALAGRLRAGQTIHGLGPWLKQVARRAAVDVRRSRARRQRRERRVAAHEELPQTAVPGEADDVARVVREEVDRLPVKYRIPLVLHYFGGMDGAATAKELGVKPATLNVRLFRARKLLAERLAGRGLALSAVVLASAVAWVVRRGFSDALVRAVARAASAGGPPAGASGAAVPVAHAAGAGNWLVAALTSSKFKLMAAAVLIVAAGAGAGAATHRLPDLPPYLDIRRLKPALPSLRSRVPGFQAKATETPDDAAAGGKATVAARDVATTTNIPAAGGDRRVSLPDYAVGSPPTSATPTPTAGGVARTGPSYTTPRNATATPPPSPWHDRPAAPAAPAVAGAPPRPSADPSAGFSAGGPIASSRAPGRRGPALLPIGRGDRPGNLLDATGINASGFNGGSIPSATGPADSATLTFTPATPTPGPDGKPSTSFLWSPGGPDVPPDPMAVNAVRLTLRGAAAGGPPRLSIVGTGDPSLPPLPDGHTFIGLWAIQSDAPFDGIDVTVRYDDGLVAALGKDESRLALWGYDGNGWRVLDGPGSGRDVAQHLLRGQGGGLQFVGVSAPEPGSAAVCLVAASVGLLVRRRRRPRA